MRLLTGTDLGSHRVIPHKLIEQIFEYVLMFLFFVQRFYLTCSTRRR